MKPKRKNADRFGRKPVKGKTGRPKYPIMTERQTAQVLFIYRNPYSTHNNLCQYFGGDPFQIYDNLAMFRADNVGFIKPYEPDIDEHSVLKPIHYVIDDRGITYLFEQGLISDQTPQRRTLIYNHELLGTHGMVHIETGIKSCSYATFLDWSYLKDQETMPAPTLKLHNPFDIPCTVDGEYTVARADKPIFGIRLELPEHTRTRYVAFEADTGSKKRELMIEQLKGYLDIETNHQYVDHFGFKKYTFFSLFLVKNRDQINRVDWIKDIIMDLTKGVGSKSILLQRYESRGEPGYIVTRDCERAGHPPLNLLK